MASHPDSNNHNVSKPKKACKQSYLSSRINRIGKRKQKQSKRTRKGARK